MQKNLFKKSAAVLLAAAILATAHLGAYNLEITPDIRNSTLSVSGGGTDFVADYLRERGLTAEQIGLTGGSPTAATPAVAGPAGFTPGLGNGGFIPSTRMPHPNMAGSIAGHVAEGPSVVGWLAIPNTNMNFPVNFSDVDNSFYLYRDWRGTNFAGQLSWRNWNNFPDTAAYLDFRTNIGNSWETTSRNISIYGHNWTNLREPLRIGNNPLDRMFAQLKSYTNINFATANPHIYFSTGDMEGIWRVFAVGYIHTTPFFFYNNPNPTREQMESIIGEWRERTHINFNVDVTPDDRLLTLTTCTRWHGNTDTQRFVVVARLLRPGESENDVVNATPNPNIRHPDFTQPVRLPQQTPVTETAQPDLSAAPAE